jgi:hypothetical protein
MYPLPGAYAWDRVVVLDLPDDWFLDGAKTAGQSLFDLGIVRGDQQRVTAVNREQLEMFYRDVLPSTVRPSLSLVAEVGGEVSPLLAMVQPQRETPIRLERPGLAAEAIAAGANGGDAVLERRRIISEPEDLDIQRIRINSYLQKLATRQGAFEAAERPITSIVMPAPGVGNSIRPILVNPGSPAQARLALVETWELRSFLGDYGLGHTLQTFSLLPGERTTITVQTWRNEASTREDASSIFDSSDTAAQTRFTSSLTKDTGSASQDQGGWALSWAWG